MMKTGYKKRDYSEKVNSTTYDNAVYLNALKEVLDNFKIPTVYYSINGYSEDAICIEQTNDLWVVYNSEKGQRYNICYSIDIKDICYEVISRISESKDEEKHMKLEFLQKIKIKKPISTPHLQKNP